MSKEIPAHHLDMIQRLKDSQQELKEKLNAAHALIKEMAGALEFYGDNEKMYDSAYDGHGENIGYVRGLEDDCDMEKIEGTRLLHHGKRARQALESYRKWKGEGK